MMNRISIYRMYSSTILLSPAYSLGFCASLFIMIQIITGYILGSNYIAKTEESFSVVNSIIMRELDTGWLIRFNHMNGCALLFICVYLHMYRSLYIHSISKTSVWIVGVLIYILLCGISLTGVVHEIMRRRFKVLYRDFYACLNRSPLVRAQEDERLQELRLKLQLRSVSTSPLTSSVFLLGTERQIPG